MCIDSGDLFHTPDPTIYTIVQVRNFTKLTDNNIPYIQWKSDSTDSKRYSFKWCIKLTNVKYHIQTLCTKGDSTM